MAHYECFLSYRISAWAFRVRRECEGVSRSRLSVDFHFFKLLGLASVEAEGPSMSVASWERFGVKTFETRISIWWGEGITRIGPNVRVGLCFKTRYKLLWTSLESVGGCSLILQGTREEAWNRKAVVLPVQAEPQWFGWGIRSICGVLLLDTAPEGCDTGVWCFQRAILTMCFRLAGRSGVGNRSTNILRSGAMAWSFVGGNLITSIRRRFCSQNFTAPVRGPGEAHQL